MVLTRFQCHLLRKFVTYIDRVDVFMSVDNLIDSLESMYPTLKYYPNIMQSDFLIHVYRTDTIYTLTGNLRDVYYYLTHDAADRLAMINDVSIDMLTCTPATSGMCGICMDENAPTVDLIQTECSHVFHKGCLRPWLQRKRTCPMCRSALQCHFSHGGYNFEYA
mgnify:CR=1 FL=1